LQEEKAISIDAPTTKYIVLRFILLNFVVFGSGCLEFYIQVKAQCPGIWN